ncbi:hypothetical protein LC608_18055 [Nostoc sp. XA010]|uniref:hypothetical protein n=1 Tax=Nostoc sp. XA010 TaxID=2780407 RepID=UPI001E39A1C8|nr:hypothetical protein [Nostoc sp. XA010]MCC5658853.1 hypothetical protein [Nostoc sp. XA010]
MESTLFTALSTNEEANLSGGWGSYTYSPTVIQGAGGPASSGGSINNGSGSSGSVNLGGPGTVFVFASR